MNSMQILLKQFQHVKYSDFIYIFKTSNDIDYSMLFENNLVGEFGCLCNEYN